MIETRPIKALNFLKKIHDDFQDLILKVKFDKEHKLHKCLMNFYGSILELTSSCVFLTDKGLITGIPIIQRAILEAYVDFLNLVKDPAYGFSLELSSIKELLKIFKAAKAGNRHLSDLASSTNLSKYINDYEKNKIELEVKYKNYTIRNKFDMVNMQEEYESIYNELCWASHNNLSALLDRHSRTFNEDIVFFKARTPEDYENYILKNIDILLKATTEIHNFFDSPVKSQITTYLAEFETIIKS